MIKDFEVTQRRFGKQLRYVIIHAGKEYNASSLTKYAQKLHPDYPPTYAAILGRITKGNVLSFKDLCRPMTTDNRLSSELSGRVKKYLAEHGPSTIAQITKGIGVRNGAIYSLTNETWLQQISHRNRVMNYLRGQEGEAQARLDEVITNAKCALRKNPYATGLQMYQRHMSRERLGVISYYK